jgi:hypothetical protein
VAGLLSSPERAGVTIIQSDTVARLLVLALDKAELPSRPTNMNVADMSSSCGLRLSVYH